MCNLDYLLMGLILFWVTAWRGDGFGLVFRHPIFALRGLQPYNNISVYVIVNGLFLLTQSENANALCDQSREGIGCSSAFYYILLGKSQIVFYIVQSWMIFLCKHEFCLFYSNIKFPLSLSSPYQKCYVYVSPVTKS